MEQETDFENWDGHGEQRAETFETVQAVLNFEGTSPVDPGYFLGNWVVSFATPYAKEGPPPFAYQSFFEDGAAPIVAIDGSFDNSKDHWQLHEDKSISLWSYVDPMPEYGIDEPTYEENRYNALVVTESKFILFNGDASIIFSYEKSDRFA